MFRVAKILSLLSVLFVSAAHAQLAITEVMTSEKGKTYPDWWELANYGTNAINLTGYRWADSAASHTAQIADSPFNGVIIPAGGVVIITETNTAVQTSNDFQVWWGGSVSHNAYIVVSQFAHGLSSSGEAVRLWNANVANSTDPNDLADMVDRIDVGAATKGVSFVYDTSNGTFDLMSANGVGGAFTSSQSDVGSPGVAPVRSPIVFTQLPASTNVSVGAPVSFTANAYGLPKPFFTWYSNNVPLDTNVFTITAAVTNNVSFSTITLASGSAQTNLTSVYSVVSYNGVQTLTNSFTFTVNPLPSAPAFIGFSPTNIWAYPNQTVTFNASASGNPPPAYEWYFNGTDTGTSGTQFVVPISNTNQSGTYSVVASNSVSTNVMSGILVVTPKPDLEITEVMSSEQTNNLNGSTTNDGDWWELSNLGTFPVNLQGFRFDDSHDLLSDAVTITNAVTIAPGESIVLVNDMTPDQFKTWWGAGNLPASLQIIDYPRIGFAAAGDSVYFWNAAATVESDYIDAESFAAATRGVSFTYNPDDEAFDGTLSVSGTDDAFTAPIGGDVGSPGYVPTGAVGPPPPNPPVISSGSGGGGGFALTWTTQANDNYAVSYKVHLTDPTWTILVVLSASGPSLSYTDTSATNTSRYYRIIAAAP